MLVEDGASEMHAAEKYDSCKINDVTYTVKNNIILEESVMT